MNKFITKVAKLVLGLSLAAGVGVAVGSKKASKVDAEATTVRYAQTSSSAAGVSSGTAAMGTSVEFNNTYTSNKEQLTGGNSMTWTFKGYSGYTISNIQADMKNNKSSGSAGITLTNNGNPVALDYDIATGIGNAYKVKTLLSGSFVAAGDLVLTISATANSAYCDFVQFGWELGTPVVTDSVSLSISKTTMELDLYDALSDSLVVTATTTGDATNGLSASSSDTDVVTISTATPTSGTSFTVTAVSVGTATITVASTWDSTVSKSCEVTVTDSTPIPGLITASHTINNTIAKS